MNKISRHRQMIIKTIMMRVRVRKLIVMIRMKKKKLKYRLQNTMVGFIHSMNLQKPTSYKLQVINQSLT